MQRYTNQELKPRSFDDAQLLGALSSSNALARTRRTRCLSFQKTLFRGAITVAAASVLTQQTIDQELEPPLPIDKAISQKLCPLDDKGWKQGYHGSVLNDVLSLHAVPPSDRSSGPADSVFRIRSLAVRSPMAPPPRSTPPIGNSNPAQLSVTRGLESLDAHRSTTVGVLFCSPLYLYPLRVVSTYSSLSGTQFRRLVLIGTEADTDHDLSHKL